MVLKYFNISIFSAILLFNPGVVMGEKFSKQGDLLYSALFSELIKQKLCSSFEDCAGKIQIYGEDGDRVHFNIYACKDRNLLAKVMEYIVSNGVALTKGVPITVKVFQETKADFLKNDSIFSRKKEIINLEINK